MVLVDGCRIPFQPYGHPDYVDLMAYDLSRLAVNGLITKTGISPKEVDYLAWGTVSQEIRTSNIPRDVALGAGLPKNVTGHTVTQACISANQAICTGVQQIQTGKADVVIAGGVETFSDAAIRFSRPLRKKLILSQKIKTPMGKIQSILKGLKLAHLAPETPAIANMLTGEVMGHSADRLASRFGVVVGPALGAPRLGVRDATGGFAPALARLPGAVPRVPIEGFLPLTPSTHNDTCGVGGDARPGCDARRGGADMPAAGGVTR